MYGGYNGQDHCPNNKTCTSPSGEHTAAGVPNHLPLGRVFTPMPRCAAGCSANKTHGCPVDPALSPSHQFPDVETLNTAKGFLAKAAANKAVPFWIGVGFVRPKSPPSYGAAWGLLAACFGLVGVALLATLRFEN